MHGLTNGRTVAERERIIEEEAKFLAEQERRAKLEPPASPMRTVDASRRPMLTTQPARRPMLAGRRGHKSAPLLVSLSRRRNNFAGDFSPEEPMAHIRRALIAGLAAVPFAATVSAAVPISLPALEIDLVDEAINLRASEIERATRRSGQQLGRLCVAESIDWLLLSDLRGLVREKWRRHSASLDLRLPV